MINKYIKYVLAISLPAALASCTASHQESKSTIPVTSASTSTLGAGNGAKVSGTGAMTSPVAETIAARIENGLENTVDRTTFLFDRALKQAGPNLPATTDITQAAGYDQVELLNYTACSTLVAFPFAMTTKYGVPNNKPASQSRSLLIDAGMRIMNRHTANLASEASATLNTSMRKTFDTLITKVIASDGDSAPKVFFSICIAANTAGLLLMGY